MNRPRLSEQTKANWDPNRFKFSLSDQQTKTTMDDTLKWYDGFLKSYEDAQDGSPESRKAYDEFKGSVDELRGNVHRPPQGHGRRRAAGRG